MLTSEFKNFLVKTITGYHLVNEAPIKESVWESILSSSLEKAGIQHEWKQGGHESGKDIYPANLNLLHPSYLFGRGI